ncbi:MAG: tRNA (adenosine(37)-N6)-threonylcarbamoyltransferase complex ATPase subunit type 1 TsaE [Parafilimonas sp.]
MKQTNFHLSEIKNIAAQLWNEYSSKKIWAFHAEMGNGKTTLISALCNVLQVKTSVSSPTFSIINEYTSPIAGTIFHMDWYRLKNEAEAIQAGCEDCIESGNYCFIEWPEKFPDLLPENTLHISLSTINDDERRLSILKN